MQKIEIPLYLNLPSNIAILDYSLKLSRTDPPEIIITFDTPVFKGEIQSHLYGDKYIEATSGQIIGSYKYTSPLEWAWNNFEFPFENQEELNQVLQRILTGEPLLEEAEFRKTPPPDIPNHFKDSYGPQIYNDIIKAYNQLFTRKTSNTSLVST